MTDGRRSPTLTLSREVVGEIRRAESNAETAPPSGPAAGKTGKECVKRLAAAGYTVRATTRGESSLEKLGVSGGNVQLMAGIDVTKPEVPAPLPLSVRGRLPLA